MMINTDNLSRLIKIVSDDFKKEKKKFISWLNTHMFFLLKKNYEDMIKIIEIVPRI